MYKVQLSTMLLIKYVGKQKNLAAEELQRIYYLVSDTAFCLGKAVNRTETIRRRVNELEQDGLAGFFYSKDDLDG